MPIYEFQCERGHVSAKLVPMDTEISPCDECAKTYGLEDRSGPCRNAESIVAKRILSPTPTNFHFADKRKARR